MRHVAVTLVALVGLALIPGVSASAGRSGIHGYVVLAPIRPVCIEDDPCSRPAANVVLAFSRNGQVAVRVKTKADGSYRVLLPAGVYRVTAPGRRVGAGVSPQRVRVPAGRVACVDLEIDTGIQ